MENEANPVIKFLLGVALVLFVGGIIVGVVMNAGKKAQNLSDEITKTTDNLLDTKYTQYDGESISGSNVLNLIKSTYSDDDEIYIQVKTKSNSTGVFYVCDSTPKKLDSSAEKNLIKDATTKSSNNYITPNKKFLGEVIRNQNDAIIGIVFEQQ